MKATTPALVAVVASIAAIGCAHRPRVQTNATSTATPTTRVDLFRNDRAVVELHSRVALQAGPKEFRIALPGRPATVDIGVVQTNATMVGWHPELALATDAAEGYQAATALAVTVTAPHAGTYDISVRYVVDVQPWRAEYRLLMQPEAGQAQLDATLVLDLPYGLPTGDLIVHDTMYAAGVTIAAGLSVGTVAMPAGSLRVPLLPSHALVATPRVTVNFGSSTANEFRGLAENPTEDNADRTLSAAVTYELALTDAVFATAPRGSATVYSQTKQRPAQRPVQVTQLQLFEGAARSRIVSVPLSEVAAISARRRRSEFAYLAARQRVVEQFDFEISNQSAVAANVTIADRAVRGTEWWLGYVNADRVAKTPGTEQDFTLQVRVPAHGARKAMYRIVYSGSQL